MEILKFQPFASRFDPTFWQQISTRKIDSAGLSQDPWDLCAHYSAGSSLPLALLSFDSGSIEITGNDNPRRSSKLTYKGLLYNANTIEEFADMKKKQIFMQHSRELWDHIKSGRALSDPSLLQRVVMFTFGDLKRFKFLFWTCVPALIMPSAVEVSRVRSLVDVCGLDAGSKLMETFRARSIPACLVRDDGEIIEDLGKWLEGDQLCFMDPCGVGGAVGWPVRNLLVLFKYHFKCDQLSVIAVRATAASSLVLDLQIPGGDLGADMPKCAGFERNSKGELAHDSVDLSSSMDPVRMAENTVDLNLKLMRWRLVPNLDLEKVARQRCLLLGAGTLGCYVARCLMAWGVRDITLVDNGLVSYSNLTRQPLFSFEDHGKPKAQVAAACLTKIFPSMRARGISISIPMPGHAASQTRQVSQDAFNALQAEFEKCDVVFLLTDSRESRWLPTLMARHRNIPAINIALGFDSYLVMRHGGVKSNLGCYFCNDVVAPSDSLKNRTLDQQCTVTRPGLASIASGLGVELLVSLLQHPLGIDAPFDAAFDNADTCLGRCPHQIRGFLAQFTNMLIAGQSYNMCTACSPAVVDAYREHGYDFVDRVIQSPEYLQSVTGFDTIIQESGDIDDQFEWDSDDKT